MRVLTYTSPWPADHPKSDEFFSDPRLAAYAVPYSPVIPCGDLAKDSLQKEVEILRSKSHWKKAYFYLWDEPLNIQQYDAIRQQANEIHAYAPDARVLTTYYSGPSDAPLAPNNFEAFLKVPGILRPHTQIYCTRNGGHMCAWDHLILILIGTWVCVAHNTVQSWGVYGKKVERYFFIGVPIATRRPLLPVQRSNLGMGFPRVMGVLYYPGEVFSSSHEPVASLRLERLLSGLQDIEYLKLYSSRYGREERLAILEKTGMYLGPERYTLDHNPIDMMRGEIFRTCRS